MIVGDEIRDLDGDVARAGEQPQAVAPALHALGVAVDRAAAMVEDELLIGEVAASRAASPSWRGNTIRSKTRPCRAKQREAGAPGRLVHDAVAGGEAARRVGVPAQYVAHADDAVECCLRLDAARALRRLASGTCDDVARRRCLATCRASPASAFRRRSRRSPSRPRHGRWRRHCGCRRRADSPRADSCGCSGPSSPSPPRSRGCGARARDAGQDRGPTDDDGRR